MHDNTGIYLPRCGDKITRRVIIPHLHALDGTDINALRPRSEDMDIGIDAVRLPDLLRARSCRVVGDIDVEIIPLDLLPPLRERPEIMRPRIGERTLQHRRKECIGLLIMDISVNHGILLVLFFIIYRNLSYII